MASPEENFLGYEKSELMKFAPKLKGKTFMLVHGTVDKRVNLQHSMQFIKSLVNANVQYKTQVCPSCLVHRP